MRETPAIQPAPDEACAPLPSTSIAPPAALVQGSESRLIDSLRDAAKQRKPLEILARAAVAHHQFLPQAGGASLGNALADLAVSGRLAYTAFQNAPPVTDAALVAETTAKLAADHVLATPQSIATAAGAALDRAYAVAWALRGPAAQRPAARSALGWIAVSGEDDTPHRPVNLAAPSLKLQDGRTVAIEQLEIPVTVRGVTVQTRFFIASAADYTSRVVPRQPRDFGGGGPLRVLPPDPQPFVPGDHRVILFLHGHSSSADEALPIIPDILKAGLAYGTKFSVVSLDLPNSGYSSTFDHTKAAVTTATTYPGGVFDGDLVRTPILDFEEDFVVAFVDALQAKTPFKDRFAGVIGGSLGGNLGLRLGRRAMPTNETWLNAGIVAWSPASVWNPLIRNEILRQGPDRARDHWNAPETSASRGQYFTEVFDLAIDPVFFQTSQPQLWYRNDWQPCKQAHIEESRRARREIYSENFRRWHWRLAGEQLIYSHIDRENHFDPASPFRWEKNKVRMLLAAGGDDAFQGTNIFGNTRALSQRMAQVPGESLFLLHTGHCMHIERPAFFGVRIVAFLAQVQTDWRWCSKCQGLFFGGGLALSRCPAGGTHADPQQSGSGKYSLPLGVPADPQRQSDWRWCNRCHGLFFGGGVAASSCPAGGTHATPQQSGSGDYSLPHNAPADPLRQADWRYCNKCQGLFFGGGVASSRCPSGGTHATPQQSGSGNYSLPHM